MRSMPSDDGDREELARLNAAPWQVECLSLNPSYPCWGPGEDHMSTRKIDRLKLFGERCDGGGLDPLKYARPRQYFLH